MTGMATEVIGEWACESRLPEEQRAQDDACDPLGKVCSGVANNFILTSMLCLNNITYVQPCEVLQVS